MASGNRLASSSALVAKGPSALGPFPRYIWIHQDTPHIPCDRTGAQKGGQTLLPHSHTQAPKEASYPNCWPIGPHPHLTSALGWRTKADFRRSL